MTNKQEKLKKLNDGWSSRCTCKLRKTATQAVAGEGSANAEIVFIGEAPGKNEDLQGLPFIGAAGKFLDKMLAEIKLEREDIYITNVVKYRPPDNRDPLPEEVRDCWPWLLEQIECIQPKIIVMLGRHSLNRFFPDEKISEVHGKLLEKNIVDFPVSNFFALYHPAAALYNGSMRETLLEDFRKIPKVLKKLR